MEQGRHSHSPRGATGRCCRHVSHGIIHGSEVINHPASLLRPLINIVVEDELLVWPDTGHRMDGAARISLSPW